MYLFFAACFLFSCKKGYERSCFKSIGDFSEKLISIDGQIDSLFLYDNIEYTIEQGIQTKVELSGGKNLLPFIDVDFSENGVTIKNENKCRFLRSYKKSITAHITVDSLTFIHYEGSASLKTIDTLYTYEMRLFIRDGAGDVNLQLVNGYTNAIITHGVGNFVLSGSTTSAFFSCRSNSYCNTTDFNVNHYLSCNSNTVGDMVINANTDYLQTRIFGRGNIKYVGNPATIDNQEPGDGSLIDLNN